MDNDTYLHNSTVIKKLDDLSVAIGGSEVPTTTIKTNSDFVIGINKSIDAASGKTGVEYPPYAHNTLVTNKLDELAEAIAEGGGGGPAPVMGVLTATENGNYIPSDYDYDGFNSVNVNVPEPPTPVTDVLNVTENGTYLPSGYSCDAFSQVNVNVEPAPTPAAVPDFVVEYEDIADDGSEKTWAVVHPGLYFLEVTGCYNNAALSVSSSNSPYFDHTMTKYIKNRYMCIDLDVGDTVTYSRESYHGLFHAIRFTNCTFGSIIEESSVQDNWTEYDAPSADGAYFMYGSCCGRSGYTQKDESVASGDCNVHSAIASNGGGMAHIIACTNQSSTATIKMYGYDNGGSSVVCLKMANVSPAPTPTFTIPEFNKTLLIDNISKASSFTLTGDYHDYDFVLIKLDYNGTIETLFLPPSVLDACTTSPFTYINFDQRNTNIYANYTISGDTWTKVYNRVTDIIEIYGCNCTNASVTETEIYYASAISGWETTVQYDGDLTEFDYIFVACNSGDPTECVVNDVIWTPTKMVDEDATFTMNNYGNGGNVIKNSISRGDTNGYPMMYYMQSKTITLTEHELSSARYLYVTGVKFTPN